MTGSDEDWTRSPEAERALGDQGPWVRHLALAWQAANMPAGLNIPLPPDPTAAYARLDLPGSSEWSRSHEDVIAYWAPLLHLLSFGLGWARPDLGLARWLEEGAPTADPVLRVVHRWWGPERVTDFLAWAATTDTLVNFGRQLAEAGPYRHFDDEPLHDRYGERRHQPAWQTVWGGGTDPLHLVTHAEPAVTWPDDPDQAAANPVAHLDVAYTTADASQVPRAVIVTDTYRAWYALFWHYRPERGSNGRSIRTDLVCKPVGWLGEYRWSSTTGAWFRGRHRWHELRH